jgi:hypothetical protein
MNCTDQALRNSASLDANFNVYINHVSNRIVKYTTNKSVTMDNVYSEQKMYHSSAPNIKAADSSAKLANIYQTTLRHIPVDSDVYNHRYKNIKSHKRCTNRCCVFAARKLRPGRSSLSSRRTQLVYILQALDCL